MALRFNTKTPKKLLTFLRGAIDDGRIVTWDYDSDGDFTHMAAQWKNKAWFRPKIVKRRELQFIILKPQNEVITSEIYAVYHGRLIEAMLAHFDNMFINASASPLPELGDVVD